MNLAFQATGAIGIPDTSSVRNLFDGARIYNKGASVLHMLRHVIGDSAFFRSLRAYANDSRFRYSTATIRDFQSVCETVSGKSLNYFFQEWIYGQGFPRYDYSWTTKTSAAGFVVNLLIDQIPVSGTSAYFTMPIDIRFSNGTWDTTVTVFNNLITQQFVFTFPQRPATVTIDPENWILKTVYADVNRPPSAYTLDQNFPNPFNPRTTITFHLPTRSNVKLKVFDVLGREIASLVDEQMQAGPHAVDWDATTTPSGIYFYRLIAESTSGSGTSVQVKKMVVVK